KLLCDTSHAEKAVFFFKETVFASEEVEASLAESDYSERKSTSQFIDCMSKITFFLKRDICKKRHHTDMCDAFNIIVYADELQINTFNSDSRKIVDLLNYFLMHSNHLGGFQNSSVFLLNLQYFPKRHLFAHDLLDLLMKLTYCSNVHIA